MVSLHIDDVNHVPLAVDVGLHLRVPAADAVTEVDAGVHELFNEFCLRLCHTKKLRESSTRIQVRVVSRCETAGQVAGAAMRLENKKKL